MKYFVFVAALLLALLANDCVARPPRCRAERISLGIAIDEEACRQRCKDFTQAGTSGCFAYEYLPTQEDCDGYILQYRPRYSLYNDCGVIAGASLAYNETEDDAQESLPPPTGCSLSEEALGVTKTAADCAAECRDLVSGNYYGCAAWLYDRSDEECVGILAESQDNKEVCGTP